MIAARLTRSAPDKPTFDRDQFGSRTARYAELRVRDAAAWEWVQRPGRSSSPSRSPAANGSGLV